MALEYCVVAERFPDGTLPRMMSDHLLALLRPELERPEAGTGVLRLLDASGHCSEAVALLRNRPTTSRRAQAAVQALAEALARGTELD